MSNCRQQKSDDTHKDTPIPMEVGGSTSSSNNPAQKETGNAVPTNDSTAQNCVPNSASHILAIENVIADESAAAANNKLKRSPQSQSQAAPDAEALNLHDDKQRAGDPVASKESNIITTNSNKINETHEPFSCKSEPLNIASPLSSKIFPIPLAPSSQQAQLMPPQPPYNVSVASTMSSIEPKVESLTSHPPFRPHFSGFSTFTPYSCTTLSSPQDCKPPGLLAPENAQQPKVKDPIEHINSSSSVASSNNGYIKNGSPSIVSKVKSMSPRISSPHKDREFFR